MQHRTNIRANVHHTSHRARLLCAYLPLIRDPERAALAGRQRSVFAAYLREELTERELECLRLYFEEGYALSDIARLLSISPATVSRNMSRGWQRMERVFHLGEGLLGQDFWRI